MISEVRLFFFFFSWSQVISLISDFPAFSIILKWMLFPILGRRNGLMANALAKDLKNFDRIMWKNLSIFCVRVQWLEVWFCCASIVLDFTKSLWRLEKTVGLRWFGRLESGMNNAGLSTGGFLTDPSFAFSHLGGDWICLWSDLPPAKYKCLGTNQPAFFSLVLKLSIKLLVQCILHSFFGLWQQFLWKKQFFFFCS